jgi:methylated-DNA-[protein]-cysteine S-methyltransferase
MNGEAGLVRWRIDTPLGVVEVLGTPDAVTRVDFVDGASGESGADGVAAGRVSGGAVEACAAQVAAYFAGTLRDFDVPLAADGTEFQRRVWDALREIPYGETRTYGWLARALGDAGASRAVGAAAGANPLAIVVPCHRLIGSGGGLRGYAGGVARKSALLDMERLVVMGAVGGSRGRA